MSKNHFLLLVISFNGVRSFKFLFMDFFVLFDKVVSCSGFPSFKFSFLDLWFLFDGLFNLLIRGEQRLLFFMASFICLVIEVVTPSRISLAESGQRVTLL